MSLGAEAEHKVPAEFVVQRDSVANPPMFFYVLSLYLKDAKFADNNKVFEFKFSVCIYCNEVISSQMNCFMEDRKGE